MSSFRLSSQHFRNPKEPLAKVNEQFQGGEALDDPGYLTVEEFAWLVRRTATTAYNWINKGSSGADDGVATIKGRIFIDWPPYPARQIRPYRRIEDCFRQSGI